MQLSEYLYETIGRHVDLSPAGEKWTARCPFHAEETPSFYVDPKKHVFHCFGCGAHGHADDFESDLLAHRAGVTR